MKRPMEEELECQGINQESQDPKKNFLPEKLLLVAEGDLREAYYYLPKRDRINRMQKVPPLVRLENNSHDYDPMVVSFGPYHHGKKELQFAEDFKVEALQGLIIDTGKSLQFFYDKVLERVSDARSCYFEDSTQVYNDPNFAQMMLLDACFIINFILSPKRSRFAYLLLYHLGQFGFPIINRDLFILENQIPFWLLKLLICSGYGKEEGEKLLDEFIYATIFGEPKQIGMASNDQNQPLHLLDAFRQLILTKHDEVKPSGHPCFSAGFGWLKCVGKIGERCSNLSQGIPKYQWSKQRKKEDQVDNTSEPHVHCFRSASDLKAKGIHFTPSRAYSLMHISFKAGYVYAQLKLPIWYVSSFTKVLFSNMIAYEICPNSFADLEVTAHIEFMKSLIDSPKDVKELREKRILFTTLGSDEEVVKVYKELKTYGLNDESIFCKVKEEIQQHYNNKAKTWLAELIYTYFRSPWTAIALLAAILLLVLTLLQTYYTIKSSSSDQ